jgi:hypothetical protein
LQEFAVLKEGQNVEGVCLTTNLLWEVEQAVLFFQRKNRPVTRWYFENQWLSSRVCPSPGKERTTIIDTLIEQGNIEIFETNVKGRTVLAIKPK